MLRRSLESAERLRRQHPPGPLRGRGRGHPEASDRRPLGACPYRRQCAECLPPRFISGLSQTVMGGWLAMANQACSLSRTKWMCKYHIVFTPKHRRKAVYGQTWSDKEYSRTMQTFRLRVITLLASLPLFRCRIRTIS